VPRIRGVSFATPVTRLGIKQGNNFSWDFECENGNSDFNLRVTWKSLQYGYQNRNDQVWLMRQQAQDFCVRDAFLFSINLPTFGDRIASTINQVSKMEI
jgi:hypothetical protein